MDIFHTLFWIYHRLAAH